ncbi:MAG: hypothetical protein M3044_14305 [Thermoproteota archaeon]|nr:hypothetical protein [Thermoproteota archaeon]
MSQPDLGNKSLPTKQQQAQNKFFFRLPSDYISFFQSMADDCYQRGKIKAPMPQATTRSSVMTRPRSFLKMGANLKPVSRDTATSGHFVIS